MFSAVASDGYQDRWNPRVLDGLHGAAAIRYQFTYHGNGSWSELLSAAGSSDLEALEIFIITRGMHWLAERDLVEADRGSAGAQAAGQQNPTMRRMNAVSASAARWRTCGPPCWRTMFRAVGLFRELAHAANAGVAPRTVEASGTPVDGTTATRDWFDAAFPKRNGNRRRPEPLPDDPPPVPPARSPQQILLLARDKYVSAVTCTLMHAFSEAFLAGRELVEAADAARQVALPDTLAETVESLEKALHAAGVDVRGLASALAGLKYGGAAISEYDDSKAGAFLQDVAE